MAVSLGKDISCTTGIRTGRFVTGARLVAEAAYRRLTTPRGMLRGSPEEENYGIDLLDLVGSVASDADAASLPGRIRSELTKDERIDSVDVTVTSSTTGPVTAYRITIEATTSFGPFTLVVKASEVTVELLDLQAA